MTTGPTPGFSNDKPLATRDYDSLNRGAFTDRIAGLLRGLPIGTGLVVGIHGPWGDGKTTVLNWLRADLSRDAKMVVHDFNPWRLTDDEAMLRGFFAVLAEAIGNSLSTRFERVRARTGKVAKLASWVTAPLGSIWKPAETANGLLTKFSKVAASGDSVGLGVLRDRIVARLKNSEKRIVILVDDIDRLDKDETHTLFRLIKACADFPNVSYVLAFDDTAVAKALGERYGGGGEQAGRAFLQKIVQVPLYLPVAAKEDLRSLCFNQVDQALAAAGIVLSTDELGEFVAGFDRGASVQLTTPRVAKQYGNGLMFALPMLKGESNTADLLLVEALRAFFPDVYQIVRSNHVVFSGVEDARGQPSGSGPRSAQLLKSTLDAMLPDQAEAVKALLVDLFPRLSGIYGHGMFGRSTFGSDWLARWSRERRISSPDYCPRYFTYAIPLNDVPDAEIKSLLDLSMSQDQQAVEVTLKSHLAGAKARRVIEKLRSVERTIDPTAAELLAVALARLAKEIPNSLALFSYAEPPSQAAILISHLIQRIPTGARRISAAKRVIGAAEPLWFGAECLRWLHVTNKPEKQDDNPLTEHEMAEVRITLVHRIRPRAMTGDPLFDPDIPQEVALLAEWRRAEGRGPVQDHLMRVFTKDPAQIARFLQSQAGRAWSEGSVLPRVAELDMGNLENIDFLIGLDAMAELIRKHCSGDFDNLEWTFDDAKPLEQRLVEQFMFVYNKWKKAGKPTNAVDSAAADITDPE